MAASISKFVPYRRIRAVLGLSVFFLCGMDLAHGDLNTDTTSKTKKKSTGSTTIRPTALPDAAVTEVNRGGETTVLLRGIAAGGGQVEFKLIQKPTHGKIVRSKPVGLDTLQVTYRHSGDHAAGVDSFIFAVRSGGVGPFSPGTAKIKINDLPGRLQVPDSLDFAITLAGETSVATFVAVNDGGERLRGTVAVTPPWKLIGSADYDLKPGGEKKLTVVFAPDRDGEFQGRVRFDTQPPVSVELKAEGKAPFLTSAKTIHFSETPAGKRTGVISIQNNTPKDISILVNSEFTVEKNLNLKFGESKELALEADGIGAIRSFLTLTGEGYQKRIEVIAAERSTPSVAAPTPEVAQLPEVAVIATATPLPAATITSSSPPPIVAETVPEPELTPEPSAPPGFPEVTRPVPAGLDAKLFEVSKSEVRLEWGIPRTTASSGSGKFSVEQRRLTLDAQEKLKIEWLAVPGAKISVIGNQGTAFIDDLKSSSIYTFRVTENAANSDGSLSSFPLVHRTPPGFFSSLDWRWLPALAGAALVFLVLKKRWQERAAGW